MAAQHHSMLTADSFDTYDALFDDDGTLDGICFDPDVQQISTGEADDRKMCNASSWCRSSSSSCCSLCRPPAVSEAGDDSSSNMFRLTGFQSLPEDTQGNHSLVSPAQGIAGLHKSKTQIDLCCGYNHDMATSTGPYGSPFQVPIKSITIPRISLNPSASGKVIQIVPIDSCNYMSTSFLPDDALCHIVRFLDAASLVRLRECNRRLREAASKNSAGWRDHCTRLWSGKANVCSRAQELLAESSKMDNDGTSNPKCAAMEAYKLSVADAATREEISFEEICFDGPPGADKAGVIWSFRFKESAGRDWTSWDPWWNGQDARKLVFLRDGTMKQVHPRGLESTSKNHSGTVLYDVFSERTLHRDDAEFPAPRIEMRWRFVRRPLDLIDRPPGAYVRITVGGRDVPTYAVRRSPTGNWGFVLESCWGVYASFEPAPRALPSSPTGQGRRRLRRTRNGSRWVDVDDSDSEGEGDDELERDRMRNVRRRIDLFVEESSMTQDGHSQWREALLYNIGAVTLPEGDGDATSEFDSALQNAMMRR